MKLTLLWQKTNHLAKTINEDLQILLDNIDISNMQKTAQEVVASVRQEMILNSVTNIGKGCQLFIQVQSSHFQHLT